MSTLEKLMLLAAQSVSTFNYPLSWERLTIDENHSFWASTTPDYRPGDPLRDAITADVAIIGGGFTGVSTAYYLSRRFPNKRIVLLEAKTLANGASGRNGGMMLNWLYGVEEMSDDDAKNIYEATSYGIDSILEVIERHNLAVSYRRDGSLEVYSTAQAAEEAHRQAEWLQSLGINIQFLNGDTLRKNIDLVGPHGALLDETEGQLNGAQYVRALRPILEAQGVEIYEQTPVISVHEGQTIRLKTPHAHVKADSIVLATNGYTGKLGYFRKGFLPLHSHVFATAPLSQDALQQIGWHAFAGYADDYDRLSYSSLTPQGNIIFGGGSNASYDYQFNNETAFLDSAPAHAFHAMAKTMHAYLPHTHGVPILHRWTGTLAITFNRNCSMGVMGEHRNIYYALGYSGHGVTLANLAGQVLTDIYSDADERWRQLPFYQAKLAPVPLEPFRWLGYQMFTRLTGRSPRLSH